MHLAELPVLVLPRSALDGADGAARLVGHVQFRAQAAVTLWSFGTLVLIIVQVEPPLGVALQFEAGLEFGATKFSL